MQVKPLHMVHQKRSVTVDWLSGLKRFTANEVGVKAS
jgi:hypothetical protein